jgi:hypothetical protein
MLFAISLIVLLSLGVPALFSYLVWRLFDLNKSELPLWGAMAVFTPGALTSFAFWGHAGPLPALLLLIGKANGQYFPWAAWMLGSGLSMVALFGWLSYRTSHAGAA